MLKVVARAVKRRLKKLLQLPKLVCAMAELGRLRKDRSVTYIVCPHGIGDTLFVASLVKAFKIHHGIRRVYLIVRENHRDLPDFFDAVDGKLVSNRLAELLTLYARTERVFVQDNFRFGHFILQFGWPEPGQLLGIHGLGLLDVYKKCVMNVPADAEIEYPQVFIPLGELDSLRETYGTHRKVVILMPYAVTLKQLPVLFWERLAEIYQQRGYKVYTNVRGDTEQPVKNSEGVDLPLKELFVVSRQFHWECVAVRSGICDMLAFSDISMKIIYENQRQMDAWCFKNMPLPNKNILEMVLPDQFGSEADILTFAETVADAQTLGVPGGN